MMKMIHASDHSKDFKSAQHRGDWRGKAANFAYVIGKTYRLDDLEENGFIHPNGSLIFEFYIKKHNFQSQATSLKLRLKT